MSLSLQNFYASSVKVHLEESLMDAISKIVRLNKHGTQSLSNDIDALAALQIEELGELSRVKKYIELLSHVDEEDSLFAAITEDRSLQLKFSQVERLLV